MEMFNLFGIVPLFLGVFVGVVVVPILDAIYGPSDKEDESRTTVIVLVAVIIIGTIYYWMSR